MGDALNWFMRQHDRLVVVQTVTHSSPPFTIPLKDLDSVSVTLECRVKPSTAILASKVHRRKESRRDFEASTSRLRTGGYEIHFNMHRQ